MGCVPRGRGSFCDGAPWWAYPLRKTSQLVSSLGGHFSNSDQAIGRAFVARTLRWEEARLASCEAAECVLRRSRDPYMREVRMSRRWPPLQT